MFLKYFNCIHFLASFEYFHSLNIWIFLAFEYFRGSHFLTSFEYFHPLCSWLSPDACSRPVGRWRGGEREHTVGKSQSRGENSKHTVGKSQSRASVRGEDTQWRKVNTEGRRRNTQKRKVKTEGGEGTCRQTNTDLTARYLDSSPDNLNFEGAWWLTKS